MKSFNLLKPYLAQNRFYLLTGFVCLIAVDLFQLFFPRVIKWAVDDLTAYKADLAGLSLYALYLVGLAIMIGLFRYGWLRCFLGTARQVEEELRNRLFTHIQTLSASYFDKTKTGDLMAHATNDMQNIRMSVGIGMVTIIDTAFLGTAGIGFMAYINVRLTMFALIPMPFVMLCSWFFRKKMHRMYGEVQGTFSELTEAVRERFAGIRIIKAYNREKDSLATVEEISGEYVNKNLKLARITGSFSPLVTFLSNLSLGIILWVGGHQTIMTTITPGDFVAFGSYLGLLTWPMMAIGTITNIVQRGKASLDRINAILETRPQVNDTPDAKPIRRFKNNIVFENVSFGYEIRDSRLEIRDLKLETRDSELETRNSKLESKTQVSSFKFQVSSFKLQLEQGQTLGIIGPPGAGKTTLLNLLPRFYDVSQGRILTDGTDIRKLKLRDVRSLISFMPQEPFLFASTIRENIIFGNPEAKEADLIRAVKAAALHDTIKSFPNGFETVVGEKGVILSGGQKQRIALARAFIRPSPILILDDPISQVDMETASDILSVIRSMTGFRTIIIVSHRISAVRFADHIITLKNGCIAESGTHEQLMQEESYYARTFHLQQIEEELGLSVHE
ncbi:ABC transporter ATP-binding protein [Desulfonema magnum]|uniref:Multidrug resistance-like ATP-binding protein MdlA n=1 Tax=Desulfonema magnum TaxID=45655 RepID=A0A975BK21_9BACT|nr:ABC transporter ATP-binding protein [Desulfonema magnum]QTA86926.1 putative ABC transporter, ATP-binding protein [Desulfonema magnum]